MARLFFILVPAFILSCENPRPAEPPPPGPSIPSKDARALGRIYTLIEENRLVLAEMRIRELQGETSSEVTRPFLDVALAEIHYRRKAPARAKEIAARLQSFTLHEVSADAHFILGKVELDAWNLDGAKAEFDACRKLAREGQLPKRAERATEYIRLTEGLILLRSGRYAEARELFKSVNAAELQVAIARLTE